MIKNIVKTIFIGLTLSLAVPLAASAESVKIGSECAYPPYNFRDSDGVLKGFEIDLVKEFGRRKNYKIKFVCQEWKGILPALMAGKYDMLVSTLSITPARAKSVDFSIPYRASTGRFVASKGSDIEIFTADGQPNPSSLDGKVLGVMKATNYFDYLGRFFPDITLNTYESQNDLELDLVAGRTDLIIAGPIKIAAGFFTTDIGAGFKFIGPELTDVEFFGPGVGAAVPKGTNQKLLADWNAYLEEMFEDGSFKKLNLKYWDFSVLPQVWQ